MGLLGELKKYVKDAMPGGLLNPEVTSQGILDGAALSTTAVPVLGDLLGLGADLHRYKNEPESRTLGNFALSGLGMLPFVPAMTAWHGSPHKFDKFSLDKIGTGEGAQAYGHGLYLAESPEVAKTYQQFGSWQHRANGQAQPVWFNEAPVQFNNVGNVVGDQPAQLKTFLARVASKGDYDVALGEVKQALAELKSSGSFPQVQDDLAQELAQALQHKGKIKASGKEGNLYKTDIPDEAVARFLDWDKPLSQQAPEVQSALKRAGYRIDDSITGADVARGTRGSPSDEITSELHANGIPGIRYLDGGSRSAGQGSSNFVVFDDQLPRILERNGVPTGQQPWKLGEYTGLLK